MSQDITYIKQQLHGHEEINSPFDISIGSLVKYITLKDESEYFYEGGEYKGMGDNVIILVNKGKQKSVPLTYMEKDGSLLYKTRLFTKTDCKVYTKEKEEYESIIQTQQRIIETMTEKIAKQGQTITNYRNENEKLKGILQEFSR